MGCVCEGETERVGLQWCGGARTGVCLRMKKKGELASSSRRRRRRPDERGVAPADAEGLSPRKTTRPHRRHRNRPLENRREGGLRPCRRDGVERPLFWEGGSSALSTSASGGALVGAAAAAGAERGKRASCSRGVRACGRRYQVMVSRPSRRCLPARQGRGSQGRRRRRESERLFGGGGTRALARRRGQGAPGEKAQYEAIYQRPHRRSHST